MIERLGGEVTRIVFLMELAGLKGREKLAKYDVNLSSVTMANNVSNETQGLIMRAEDTYGRREKNQ